MHQQVETIRVIRIVGTEAQNNFYTMDMVVDKDRNIIVTGYANDSVFYDNGLTFKLSQPVEITQTNNIIHQIIFYTKTSPIPSTQLQTLNSI